MKYFWEWTMKYSYLDVSRTRAGSHYPPAPHHLTGVPQQLPLTEKPPSRALLLTEEESVSDSQHVAIKSQLKVLEAPK